MAEKKVKKTGAAVEIALSSAAGGVTGGPVGAVVGGSAQALNEVVQWVRGKSFGGSALAALQEDRLGEAIEEAAEVIEYMQMLGHYPRNDWFNVDLDEGKVYASTSGVELLEGTMIAAANEYERRKVKLVANLWSQLAFNPSVAHEDGVFLLKTVNALSYHQLAVLATLTELSGPPPSAEQAKLDLAIAAGPVVSPNTGHDSQHSFTGSLTTAIHVLDLIHRDIVRQEDGRESPSDARKIRPWRCAPTLLGRRLYILTAMRTHIDIAEKSKLAAELVKHR